MSDVRQADLTEQEVIAINEKLSQDSDINEVLPSRLRLSGILPIALIGIILLGGSK